MNSAANEHQQPQLKISTSTNAAPFGSAGPRFGKFTFHPGLDKTGLYGCRPTACDPCCYHPKELHEIFEVNKQRKLTKDPWTYKSELKAWAQNLGYRNQKILAQRRWQQSILGPAWTEVSDPPRYEAACKNLGFGRTSRFKPTADKYPGPGTYYKNIPFKAPYGSHSTRPTLEREEPCRFKDICPRWSLAPNRYTIVDKECIEQRPQKVVSLRGPYDLFTGKRDGNSIKNHFNRSLRCSATTWPLALPGCFEKYKRLQFGKMNKTNRDTHHRGRVALVDSAMCQRRPGDPGPAHYDVDTPKVFKQCARAFNSSHDRPPGYCRAVVWPGVGRYRAHAVTCGIPGRGHRHVFQSKIGRTIGAVIPEPMNSF